MLSAASFRNDSPVELDILSPVKLILVTGSVISGVGKGIISSSLGMLLKANGYRVTVIKIDPYINVDAGTFSPYEHGEVFVLDDGGEVDLDLGNYERFLDVQLTKDNNITTGKIYHSVIKREREGKFLGKTVQTVPHITDAIIEWIERVAQIPVDGTNLPPHVCVVELGGTIGDVESLPYTKAFSDNIYNRKYDDRLLSVHVTKLITLNNSGEIKTKPAQNGIQKLREIGLFPDLVMCRSENPMDSSIRKKVSKFSQINPQRIIDVYDVSSIYRVPLLLESQNVLEIIKNHLKLESITPNKILNSSPNILQWRSFCDYYDNITSIVKIALVGKYVTNNTDKIFEDAYASVIKALNHASLHCRKKLQIEFIKSESLEDPKNLAWDKLRECSGIVVPGGFGVRGFEGIIAASKYARENKIPYLGICLGMQCAAVEFARNVCDTPNANSTEFFKNLKPDDQVIIDMPEHDGESMGMGGTMRLGKRTTTFLTKNCVLNKLYFGKSQVEERHRHRYEVNPLIVPKLSQKGFLFVGMGVDEKDFNKNNYNQPKTLINLSETGEGDNLESLLKKIENLCLFSDKSNNSSSIRMEICEILDHPYFVGVQYHPEYLSHPLKPSPPFFGLILAATSQLNDFFDGIIPSPAARFEIFLKPSKKI